jgi:hypothetical protein
MGNKFNLKTLIYNWFDYEKEDEVNRPVWIEEKVRNYKNGEWLIGKKKC